MRLVVTLLTVLLMPFSAAAVEMIAPEELEVGEPGRCVTEMDGGELVEIPVTVVGLVGAAAPEGEMVLIRLHGERFEHAGIIAGMSGSPVYVRDRLLGALAFGWAFSKDPIAGVTPFTRMVNLADPEADGGGRSQVASSARPSLERIVAAASEGALGDLVLDWLLPENSAGPLTALPLPVASGGVRPGHWLAAGRERLGWVDAPAAGASAAGSGSSDLFPGAAVCGVMMDGDAVLSVGGTVTEVRGDEVWAFGHPFLGGGHLRMPMARGHVVAVLPSIYSSFKFISPQARVGAIEVDRTHGIWGRVGEVPELAPIEVRVAERTYRFRALRDPILLPYLVGYATASSHGARGRQFGDATVRASVEVTYAGRTARLEETFVGLSAAAEAAGYASSAVAFLENGAFAAPAIDGVRVTLDPVEQIERAAAVDIVVDRRVVAPGETVTARVRMRHHGGAEDHRQLSIEVPSWISDGKIDLVVADGASWSTYDLRMRPPSPDSFMAEMDLFARVEPSSRLVVALERKESGLTVGGGSVAAPPGLILNLGSGLGGNVSALSYRVAAREAEDLPFSFAGAARIPLTVSSRATGNLMDGVDDS